MARRCKVSVILMTYNHASFIGEAIDSILRQQTDFDFEIVVLDDASTDNTRDIIMRSANAYPEKFSLAFNETNLGLGRAGAANEWRVRQSVMGTYVAHIDGDDYWTDSRKLQKQVDFLDNNPEFVVCANDYIIRNEWLGQEAVVGNLRGDTTLHMAQLFDGCPVHESSLLYRNGVLPKWPDEFLDLGFSDWPLIILLAQRGGVRLLADPMSVYRVHSGGAWSGEYVTRSDKLVPDTNAAGLRAVVNFLERINAYLEFEYDADIRPLIVQRKARLAALMRAELSEH